MKVVKRNGSLEPISFDKVLGRIRKASKTLMVNPDSLAQQVLARIYDGVKTSEIDELTSQLAVSLSTNHPDYGILASRIAISNHQKNTDSSFSNVMLSLANQINTKTNEPVSHVNDILVSAIKEFGKEIDAKIDYDRDYLFDYFGFKTFEKSYLLRDSNRKVLERPQHLWMRVSLAIWPNDMKKAFETYDYMSQKYFTHATPTLFNAGTNHQQLSSCFLLAMTSDSVSGIYKTLSDCALISKHSGGIGLHISNIRARGSAIKGTNGISDGIVPMLRVFNNTARYINQGGRRNGSFAMYLEPWHADVEDFLRMKQNTGAEEERARDLFYALWIPDLFMRRIESNGTWSLFCPNEAPGLDNVIGEEFEALYMKYENEKRYRKQVSAQKLWFQILDSQIESGTPYLLYKDAANKKSNQQNLGIIKSSNLCVAPETPILTDKGHIQIKDAVNTKVNVWNGTQFSEVEVKQTGKNQKLIKVVIKIERSTGDGYFSYNKTLYCTEYHKFILPTHPNIKDCERIEAYKLVNNTHLMGYYDRSGKSGFWAGKDGCSWVSQKVISVDFDGRYDDTYCFNEPINHAGVFNGILTGNCTEIIEYSDANETAVCNLASIGLPTFVKKDKFDFNLLRKIVVIVTTNLNRVIDINFYPTPETKRSNMRHRPIGIGVQGLADVFAMLKMSWDSKEAIELNKKIFEHMYYAALEASVELAKKEGPYETFQGSPASKGVLQFDMWNVIPSADLEWDKLKKSIVKHGLRNSLLVAPMPTASTSQILGFNECFEPFTTNIYSRRTLAGEYIVINKYLVKELLDMNMWDEEMKQMIIANNGSIQLIEGISNEMKNRYKTGWELSQKVIIDMAADRGAYICQSQSLNLFVADPNYAKLTSMHFHAWKRGLKTGCYYLRTKAPVAAQKFTVTPVTPPTNTTSVSEKSEEKIKRERKELLDKLAAEYQEEQDKGCTNCSA